MEIGTLDRRIVIQTPTRTQNAAGEYISRTWATHTTVWASKEDTPGDEVDEADQRTALNRVVWIIRYKSTVTELMRIYWNSKYYYITSIQEVGRKWGMRLITEIRD
jgi:SPP1 family predicted phage head-tail adaptor